MKNILLGGPRSVPTRSELIDKRSPSAGRKESGGSINKGKRAASDSLETRSSAKKFKTGTDSSNPVAAAILASKDRREDVQKDFANSIIMNDVDALKKAIQGGADVNKKVSEQSSFALCIAARDNTMLPILETLLAAGADVNLGNNICGPLLHAVHAMNLEAADLLLKAGADPFAEGAYDTPFVTAIGMSTYENEGRQIYELFQPLAERKIGSS